MDARIKKLHDLYVSFQHYVHEYDAIFQDDDEHQEIIKMLPEFFADLKNLYFERFIMFIFKLLERYVFDKENNNLSLYALPAILKEKGVDETTVKNRIDKLKGRFQNEIEYAKKYLKHFDLPYSIGERSFNTSTHMDDVNHFVNEMLSIVNDTLVLTGEPKESGVVIDFYALQGTNGLMNILKQVNKSNEI